MTPRTIPGPEDELACPIIVYSTVLLKNLSDFMKLRILRSVSAPWCVCS